MRGFTLIELMIVLAIVGLLAAIAYPSYRNQIRKTKRSDGHVALTATAQQMERCFTVNGRYNEPDNCPILTAKKKLAAGAAKSPEGNYTLELTTIKATQFTLQASPSGFKDPDCGTLTLNQAGKRGATGNVDDCW